MGRDKKQPSLHQLRLIINETQGARNFLAVVVTARAVEVSARFLTEYLMEWALAIEYFWVQSAVDVSNAACEGLALLVANMEEINRNRVARGNNLLPDICAILFSRVLY